MEHFELLTTEVAQGQIPREYSVTPYTLHQVQAMHPGYHITAISIGFDAVPMWRVQRSLTDSINDCLAVYHR